MSDLGPTGSRVWDELSNFAQAGTVQRLLIIEICRSADRLDVLDEQVHAHEDRAFSEARQEAMVMKHLLNELRQYVKIDSQTPEARENAATITNLAERIANRKKNSAS